MVIPALKLLFLFLLLLKDPLYIPTSGIAPTIFKFLLRHLPSIQEYILLPKKRPQIFPFIHRIPNHSTILIQPQRMTFKHFYFSTLLSKNSQKLESVESENVTCIFPPANVPGTLDGPFLLIHLGLVKFYPNFKNFTCSTEGFWAILILYIFLLALLLNLCDIYSIQLEFKSLFTSYTFL